MSDTPTPANLASSEEFDARLKRTDEDRWLASRYAPPAARRLLVAIYLFHQELQRTLHTKEPMLGKIRLQWWRETLEQVAGKGALRRHDLAEELSRVTRCRSDLILHMNELIDRFDDIIDDHMHAGHTTDGGHAARHLATEACLARLAGLSLDPAAKPCHLNALASAGEAYISSIGGLADAGEKLSIARQAVRRAPVQLWPAILHLSVLSDAAKPYSPLAKRWRMFWTALRRRL